jgi:hypothetical protein
MGRLYHVHLSRLYGFSEKTHSSVSSPIGRETGPLDDRGCHP